MTATPSSWMGSTTMGLTWLDRIDAAVSVPELLDLVRVYLAHLTPDEVNFLPRKCRPRKLLGPEDLSEYAFDLVRETCVHDAEPLVLKVAAVISHASARISELVASTGNAAGGKTASV